MPCLRLASPSLVTAGDRDPVHRWLFAMGRWKGSCPAHFSLAGYRSQVLHGHAGHSPMCLPSLWNRGSGRLLKLHPGMSTRAAGVIVCHLAEDLQDRSGGNNPKCRIVAEYIRGVRSFAYVSAPNVF